ncbi:uncharacterized protein LOC122404178 [Colletes gigas]|uniref:uncharacterized protein LOC122404178 n=1 Tax=Colletes gigas TaxID=935657 RepID=UPI001C9B73D4|nr:uncharacterized protein LOC122404178 [Colletes gigas]
MLVHNEQSRRSHEQQKSSNNEYQRKSFSGQKKVPLCKPFTICTTDGYIVDILGPYYATQNDASIMKEIMTESNGLCNLMKKGDIFILDRGFRDVKNMLTEQGYGVLMPALKGKRPQLSTIESNDSRFVTKLRWVVEAIHGILKQKYRLLDRKLDNKMLPKIGIYCKIASFLQNRYGKRLNSDAGRLDIIAQMKEKKNQENSLSEEIEKHGWSRKKLIFSDISTSDIFDFPEMTENDLHILFTGSYQFSQAISYLAEILNADGSITAKYVKERSNILKLSVKSRHINKKTYRCYIEYLPNTIGHSGVTRYACECASGKRTVGCCSHVAALIYYLAHGRYLSKILKPAEILTNLFTKNEIHPIINENSDIDD